MTQAPPEEKRLVDAVLLIDGDNDPHLPPDFPVTQSTLVRVFLRPAATAPRGLERKLGTLPLYVAVSSPKGGANAADFVMSLHIGILHATLPLHIPFMIVTHDKSLAVACQELQRIGRQATLWTSHPERSPRRTKSAESPAASPSASRRRGGRRSSRASRSSAQPAAVAPPAAETAAPKDAAPQPGGRSVAEVAAAYAARLARIKDPPSRLKTLINDIANRAGRSGHTAEQILEALKANHGVSVDSSGKVTLAASAGK